MREWYDSPLQEHLGLARICENGTLNLPQTCLTTLQSTQLNLSCHSNGITSLDPRNSNVDVLLIGLYVSVIQCKLEMTYIGVGSVNHDGVKFDALLSETDGKFELLRISGVVEVDGDGY